jgi:hypothetical protein
MAFADPPYPGQAAKHYADHPDYAGEVDHAELVARLVRDYPDGWALSTSSPALRDVLPLCPPEARVMAWAKPFAAFKRNVRVAYAWEPVIVKVAERLPGAIPTRDYVAEPITLRRGLVGAKPDAFCRWLFAAMGLRPGDELHDLFPGSGAVARAWEAWSAQGTLGLADREGAAA